MHHTASCCEFNYEVTVAQEVEQVTNGASDCMARDWTQRSCVHCMNEARMTCVAYGNQPIIKWL